MSTLQTTILKHPDSTLNNIQFDNDGRVGVQTSTPVHHLHVNSVGTSVRLGLTNFSSGSSGSDGCQLQYIFQNFQINNKESGPIEFLTADQSRMQIGSDGKIGMGTSSPATVLHVDSDNNFGNIVLSRDGGVANRKPFGIGISGSLDNQLRICASSDASGANAFDNQLIDIVADGNVGIGTTNPLADLTISNGGAHGIELQPNLTTNLNRITNYNRSTNAYVKFQLDALDHEYALSGAPKLRLKSNGLKVINPSSATNGDSFAAVSLGADQNSWMFQFVDSAIGAGTGWGTFWAGSTDALYRRLSTETNPNEYVFVGGGSKRFTFDLDGGGNAYFDGSLEQNSYDYAEYFEWEDGNLDNEDRRGYSVFINSNGNIEKATAETDPNDIVGVVSGTSSIIGDAAAYNWHGKYELDEWGTRKLREVTRVSWTDDDGVDHGYDDENNIPADVVVPDDALRRVYHKYIESESYDPSQEYIPRDQRQEWAVVGLLGKVRVRDESPKNPNWRLIKTVAGKQLWLIR